VIKFESVAESIREPRASDQRPTPPRALAIHDEKNILLGLESYSEESLFNTKGQRVKEEKTKPLITLTLCVKKAFFTITFY
jgi:hypothetical protein